MLLGQRPRRLAVSFVVGVDPFDGIGGLTEAVEREQSVAGRERYTESGVLRHHRLAAREIAGVTLTEPAAAQSDVLVLGNGELSARCSDEIGVRPEDIQ